MQNLRDVQKMRSMQGLIGREEDTADTQRSRSLQKNLQQGRSVDDDQWAFLSARTAAAADGRGRVGWRLARRRRISSRVGRSGPYDVCNLERTVVYLSDSNDFLWFGRALLLPLFT